MRNIYFFIAIWFITLAVNPDNIQAQTQEDSLALSRDSLDIMIGQMIMTGVGDFSYITSDESILYEIRSGRVGGIVLFEKNVNRNSPTRQLTRLIDSIQAAADIPLLVSIDEEGGKVTRLKAKYGFPKTVTAAYLGQVDNLDSTAYYAAATASTLRNLGINLNYAPTVDVAVNPNNPVIAKVERSYSEDPLVVARHAGQVIKTHREHEVLTVLKHFPGHGSSHADTHLGIADVSDYWLFKELLPYKALLDSGLVDAIMTAHIVNSHLDENKLPATLSPFIVKNILRGLLGYEGVVFSDDMQMHAISKEYGFEQSIRMAIEAGVDVLMFANNVPGNEKRSPKEIHGIITKLVSDGYISRERIKVSFDRIMTFKSKIISK